MRKSCLECVSKHLGSAAVYIEEVSLGYPNYFGYAYGELNHASSESLAEYPDLAFAIREHRIKWANTRKSGKQHRIPFEAMFSYINALESVEGEASIAVPQEVYEGLDKDETGDVVLSTDTRP